MPIYGYALHNTDIQLSIYRPTVGVDPLLRQSIWNHLVHITKAGQKTVIITTHYIEEARQAHTVCLLHFYFIPKMDITMITFLF